MKQFLKITNGKLFLVFFKTDYYILNMFSYLYFTEVISIINAYLNVNEQENIFPYKYSVKRILN